MTKQLNSTRNPFRSRVWDRAVTQCSTTTSKQSLRMEELAATLANKWLKSPSCLWRGPKTTTTNSCLYRKASPSWPEQRRKSRDKTSEQRWWWLDRHSRVETPTRSKLASTSEFPNTLFTTSKILKWKLDKRPYWS
jgi:hypothetical protein